MDKINIVLILSFILCAMALAGLVVYNINSYEREYTNEKNQSEDFGQEISKSTSDRFIVGDAGDENKGYGEEMLPYSNNEEKSFVSLVGNSIRDLGEGSFGKMIIFVLIATLFYISYRIGKNTFSKKVKKSL